MIAMSIFSIPVMSQEIKQIVKTSKFRNRNECNQFDKLNII